MPVGRDQGRADVRTGCANPRLGRALGINTVHTTVHSPKTACRMRPSRRPCAREAQGPPAERTGHAVPGRRAGFLPFVAREGRYAST